MGTRGSSPSRFRLGRLVRLCAVTLAILYIFSRFIPAGMQDYVAGDEIDNAWAMALHEAFVEHLQFGTEVVFTYGPWGFLAHGYDPQTHLLSVVIWSGLTVLFISGGWQLARALGGHQFYTWPWLVLLAALATAPAGNDFDSRLILFLLLPLLLHFFTERALPTEVALVAALGCLGLVKFTGLIEAAFVVGLISVDDVFRRRRFPWAAPLWAASLLVFWLLAWQGLGNFGAFLVHSWQLSAGYTEAMMLPGHAPLWSLCGYLALAAALWLLAAEGMWLHLRRWALLPLTGVGASLFVAFKLGYIRHDKHQMNSAMALLIMAGLLLPFVWRESKRLKVTAVGLLLLAGIFAGEIFNEWAAGDGLAAQLGRTFTISSLLAPVADAGTGYSRTEYEKARAAVRARNPLPPIHGGADLYSYDQEVLFAYGLHYQPRPVIQSYAAFTSGLAEMNAAWLRSNRAASNILFAVQPLDRHLPSLDDGLSWPELLTRYDISNETGAGLPYLLLQRRPVPRGYKLVPLGKMDGVLGGSMAVPAVGTAPVWAEMEFRITPAGKLISAIYKPPMLVLTVTLGDGSPGYFRIVPGMAEGGFLLSPVVMDTKSFAALYKPGWKAGLSHWEVRSLMVTPGIGVPSSVCYEPTFEVRFYRLEVTE